MQIFIVRKVFRNRYLYALFCLFMLSLLFFAGRGAAKLAKQGYLNRTSKLLYLFEASASDMARIQRLLADPDPIVRSAGYYGLLESGNAETDFLLGRYEDEMDSSVRMAILYVLYKLGEDEVLDALKAESSENIREYIESTLQRQDESLPEVHSRILF